MDNQNAFFSSAYLAPIRYYARYRSFRAVEIEQFDHYTKQTYRNRCTILGGNGPINLIVPVIKKSGAKTLMKDVKIAYDMPWQANHWQSIKSAYNSSPFFEYYADDIEPFYRKKYKFLMDFNTELHQKICEILELDDISMEKTSDFIPVNTFANDFRFNISPKVNPAVDPKYRVVEYTQTFIDRFGFTPEMSIIDLIFNMGPDSDLIIGESLAI